MFEKRVDIYKKRDSETWKEIKKILSENGVKGVKSGHYLQDTVMSGGCGAKLDPRNFGPNGKIDREIYWVKVPEGQEGEIRELLLKNGVTPIIEDDLMVDASKRKKADEDVFFK